jgi:hypothetical protein
MWWLAEGVTVDEGKAEGHRRRRFLTYSAYLLIMARCREPNQTVL